MVFELFGQRIVQPRRDIFRKATSLTVLQSLANVFGITV